MPTLCCPLKFARQQMPKSGSVGLSQVRQEALEMRILNESQKSELLTLQNHQLQEALGMCLLFFFMAMLAPLNPGVQRRCAEEAER